MDALLARLEPGLARGRSAIAAAPTGPRPAASGYIEALQPDAPRPAAPLTDEVPALPGNRRRYLASGAGAVVILGLVITAVALGGRGHRAVVPEALR